MNRIVSKGSLADRDRLLNYTVDEYFAEINAWMMEQENIQAQMEKQNTKAIDDGRAE